MDGKELLTRLAEVHNRLTEISVRGEDTIRMANVLQEMRSIVMSINEAYQAEDLNETTE